MAWQVLTVCVLSRFMHGVRCQDAMQVLKRTVQTAVVWTMYEELVPRVTRMAEALRQSTPRS